MSALGRMKFVRGGISNRYGCVTGIGEDYWEVDESSGEIKLVRIGLGDDEVWLPRPTVGI